MLLYHGSNTNGITRLEPHLADHERPYVYLTTNEVVAAFYLCNAVERPYYWFPYGFENGSDIPVYHELYSNALREVSQGVKGYIYIAEAREDQYIPLKNIPCARLGITSIEVAECIEVPDAYDLFQKYISEGRMKVSCYEEKTAQQLGWWYRNVADYMQKKRMIDTPDCSYARFVRDKIPKAWKIYTKLDK